MKNRVMTVVAACLLVSMSAAALEWRTSWTAAAQGPYPIGFPQGQPDLSLALPDENAGARDQTLRMMVRPDIWGDQVRIRFTNVFGSKPLILDGVFVGLQQGSAAVVDGTNQPVRFNSDARITIPPGEYVWSDPVYLPFVRRLGSNYLYGRKLAISFHVVGESGPLTWHALANSVNYLSWPGAGSVGAETGEKSFPFTANSWFLIDAVDMSANADTQVVVCFGDSITDGHMSSLNGDDRWPDAFSRIAKAERGNRISIVNSGICGNQIAGPADYADNPFGGGPAAKDRIDRDILNLSGVDAVIWLEGINDIHAGEKTVDELIQSMRDTVSYLKSKRPSIRVIGATLPSSLGSTLMQYGEPGIDVKRRALNDFIRSGELFDAVVDFDAAIGDVDTGKMRPEFAPDSAFGGPGDFLHPNRAGYQRMAEAVKLAEVLP